ncbi:NAD-dependent succinate-semialdehyde dehydrogenase [Pedobacter aquae]|uniref:NAD-dependent succinate-semialdehyde dehydrogenase n=1 Tax=Pedobacter aquae TaxID=2605747 RepID=A0A5C0VI12_9SPHI|nr:NAD-dependent succinate-semialdehyde dehydrogenase [Pedobacter aquae]QEK51493.1 NAD-dependent succinate-semialdehyde dehydrogenase [Pedobacter aquae]
MNLKSINPYNGKQIATYKQHSQSQLTNKVQKTHKAWISYQQSTLAQRAVWMENLAQQLLLQQEHLAKIVTEEMGKPLQDGLAEVKKCAAVCQYYAKHAAAFLKDEIIDTDAKKSFISYQPLGIVLAIMPWNFPYWQVFRFLAPALMAGNAGLLKHASNVSACALAIEKLVYDAGFPEDIFQVLLCESKNLAVVIENPLVKAITLTGSTQAGIQVAKKAGELLKKTVLELGGSDAYIILEDADLEQAAEICVNSRLINNGQSCIAAKRFIVVKTIEKAFTKLFVAKIKAKTYGNPTEPGIDLGPMARTDLRDELHQQVIASIKKGAKCVLGGFIPEGKGAFYPPTVLTQVKKGMPAYEDELFGPVAAIISAKNEDDAIKIANDTVFGLGGAIFTKDLAKGELIAKEKLQAGSCFVNSLVKSDPRLPFGGINQSGYGRELSLIGMREFLNIKTVYIQD